MNSKLLLGALTAAAILLSGAASASPFDGVYGGGSIGGATGSAQITDRNTGDRFDAGFKGMHAGFFGGYGKVFSGTYVGVEGQFNFSNLESQAVSPTLGERATLKNDKDGAILARFGYTFSRDLLAFASVGWSNSHWQAKATNTPSSSSWIQGYRFGAGIEQSLGGNTFWGLGYDATVAKANFANANGRFEPITHRANLRFGYRF